MEFEDALRAAFERGRDEYGALPLGFEAYADQALRVIRPRAAGEPRAIEAALGAPPATDLYLAIACDARVPGAWELLEQRFAVRLEQQVRRFGATPVEAEELVRELPGVLINPSARSDAATLIGTYDASGTLFSWLTTILSNRLTDRRRRRKTDSLRSSESDDELDPPGSVVNAETVRRIEEVMKPALLDLPARDYFLLTWKYHDNLPQHEMARRLGVSEARVSQLLKRVTLRISTAVRDRIRDESAPYWAAQADLWTALRNVVRNLLAERRD